MEERITSKQQQTSPRKRRYNKSFYEDKEELGVPFTRNLKNQPNFPDRY